MIVSEVNVTVCYISLVDVLFSVSWVQYESVYYLFFVCEYPLSFTTAGCLDLIEDLRNISARLAWRYDHLDRQSELFIRWSDSIEYTNCRSRSLNSRTKRLCPAKCSDLLDPRAPVERFK